MVRPKGVPRSAETVNGMHGDHVFDRPLVSVVVPAFNAALARAISSMSMQDYRPMEILSVDDGSTDNSQEVANDCAERGVNLIAMGRITSEAAAMNAGIKEAKGGYIAFLDAADESFEGKIAKPVDLMGSPCGGLIKIYPICTQWHHLPLASHGH